jgi:hypothetical protein
METLGQFVTKNTPSTSLNLENIAAELKKEGYDLSIGKYGIGIHINSQGYSTELHLYDSQFNDFNYELMNVDINEKKLLYTAKNKKMNFSLNPKAEIHYQEITNIFCPPISVPLPPHRPIFYIAENLRPSFGCGEYEFLDVARTKGLEVYESLLEIPDFYIPVE